jgi:hypothetical protein
VLPPRIDETEAVPYKPRQLSDIPAETANATRVALVVLVSLPLSTLPRMRGRVERGRSPGLIREEGREADLSTEQACAQAPSWLPNPDGYSGRSQGAQRPSCARAQAAQRLTARPLLCAPHPFGGGQVAVRRLWHVGAMERLKRRKDFLAAAAATSVSTPGFVVQERRRVDGGPESGRRGGTQPLAPAIEGNCAAFRRRWPGCRQRLCAGWTAGCAGHSLRQNDRGFRGGASTPEDEEAGGPELPSRPSPAAGAG